MSAENKFKNGDVITDGLVNGEIIGEGQLGRMRIDGYRIRITSGNEKGHESFISKADAEMVLDKSANSSIMTSNKGDEDDNNRRHDLQPGNTQTESAGLRETDARERMEKNEVSGSRGTSTTQSNRSEEHSRELYPDGDGAVRSVAEGNPGRDTGEGQRLTPKPEPKDIELNGQSDIGFNAGAATRFDANIAAIKLSKQIESENRLATPDEQKILSKYSGFGDSAMGEAFPVSERAKGWNYDEKPWGKRRKELQEITTPQEFARIEGSRLNAFYTTPPVIDAMWKTLDNMGVGKLDNPRVMEPGAGSGRFLGYEPKDITNKSERVAVELDTVTGRILKELYPKTETYVMGFEQAPIPKDSIDVAISNVPFGNYQVFDPTFKGDKKKFTHAIHNYYFVKTMEELRPGGVLAFITTHETMDAPSSKPIRQYLADQADMEGAIRLPNNAFPDTSVVTDVIFMRKRMAGEKPGDQTWVNSSPVPLKVDNRNGDFDVELNQNDYFTKHPEMIMGKATGNGSMNPHKQYTEGEYTVEPDEDVALSTQLNKAVAKMPHDIVTNAPRQAMTKRVYGQTGAAIREGTRTIGEDGRVYVQHGTTQESANLTATEEAKVKDMLAIRDAAKKVVDIQVHDQPESVLTPALENLRSKYKAYVLANGTLTSAANADLMDRDPDAPFLKALENNSVFSIGRKDLTEEQTRLTKVIKGTLPVEESDIDKIQMPIFKKRIIHGLGDKPINSYADAESVVNNEVGSLDYDLMAEKLGKSREDVIAHLAAQKLIYKNPMTGEWEPADKYLTGDVRTKLKQAEAAAAARPKDFKGNYDDLKVVQPADIPAGQIAVHMGAPWIPESDVNEFVVDLMDVDKNEKQKHGYSHYNDPEKVMKYVQYVSETGKWHVAGKSDFGGNSTNMTETYGTDKMPAHEIIGAILNGKLVEVKKWDGDYNEKGEKIMVRDDEGTVAAQEKAKLIQTKFLEWIWSDPERTDRLAKSYNDKFNNYRPRTFDGKHLDLPGISEKWHKQMLSHQKDAVWRVVQDRTALLAHEVGFGKTAVMVTSGMELRRMGLSRKNLYVVPKATHGQFRDDFLDIYPTAKILFPEDDDFTPAKRPEFISRAVTGDWDAVIISDSQFERIPVRPETELKFQQEELDNLKASVEASGDDKTTQKQLEKKVKNTEVKILKLQDKLKEKSDKAVYFEDLGVDQMYVDEADAYKNLKFATSMGRVKGLPNSEADRAWDMYTKTRTLQEDKHAGVVFATGTPIANTIAEMYTMMRYLQEPMLEEKGLQHFDAWAKTFGETTESLEQTPTGAYKVTQRFSKFGNAPELSNIWQQTADIRVADEVPEMVAQRPRIVDEQGKSRRIVVPTPGDKALADYMAELSERADQLKGKPEKGGDNMLKISSDARKASLDMRLVKANAPINPKGKVTVACTKITEIYKETTPDKGTQLVFLDLGTPKAQEKEPEHDANGVLIETDDDTKEETALLKDVYAGIKAQLIANGIPEKDIAFIHDAKNQVQRKVLYAKVNSGEIRVLIGSTGKMGAGVNVQERAAALHHLDAPWRPRDIEQREGRVIRQGNKVYGPIKDEDGKVIDPGKGVRIYTYVTEKSFDAFMWQAIEAKSKAIKSIMRRAVPPRSIEDVDSFTLSASEAKAIASGNPDVFKQVSLKNAVARYAMLKASHTDQVIRAKSQIRALPKQIEDLNGVIGKMEKDAKLVKENPKFAMKVQGDNFEERSEAGPAILNAIKHAANNEKIGEYQGFDVKVLDHGPQAGYELLVENTVTGQRYSGGLNVMYADMTGPGAVVRLDNIIKKVPQRLEDSRKQLKEAEKNLETYKGLEAKPFEYEKQLDSAEKELDRISKKLQGQKVEGNESDNYVPEPEPEEIEPEYHYSARGEEIKAEDEVAAVKAEVGNVEKETVVKAEPAAQVVEIVEKMPEPEVTKAETTLSPSEQKTIEKRLKEISQSKDMAYDNAIYDKGSSLKKLEDEETNLRAKLNFATRTKAEEIEKQTPSVYAKSEYQGPPVMGVDKKGETKEEKPKVEAPIVEPEKPKLASFPGNDTNKISGSFNVYNLDAYISGKHLSTPAEKITIPGFEEYNFFIARPTTTGGKFSNKDWDIYETTTGMSIGALRETKQKAIDEATHKLKDFIGKEKLTKAIADGLEKQSRDRGLAPQPRTVADIATVATEPKAEAEAVTAPAESSLVQAVRTENHKEEERLAKQGGTGKMVLMTKELAKQFPRLYSGEKIPEGDRLVIAKFFHPMSHQTWYATEYDPEEQIFYGYVDTGDDGYSEWGNFSLAEMQDLKVKGLGMERDIHFTPQKIGNVSGLQDRFKTSPEPEVKGTFRQDVPIDELVEEKKAAETTTTPEPKAPASKEEETPANPKLEDEFYANMDEGHGFKSIKAKKVVIPGYEKFDLYLHHPASVDKKGEVVEDKDHWGISEGRSGLYLGDDITSPQADWAVDRLKSKLARKMTPDKLEQSVENAIKNTGESPKYETETPIAKMQRQVHEIYNSKLSDFVSNELPHDEAYQNALKHSDPQNIEVELQAAIKRAKGKEVLAKLAESQGSQPSAATKVEEPTHPFIGLYKGKQYESHAVSMYAAQKEIAKRVGARHDYDVSVYAATETEPLAAAIEHEKTQSEETPYIEEGGKATRKSKPSIETQAVAHVQQQIPEEAPIVEGEVKRKSKPSIDNEYGKPVREPSEKVVLTPSEVKTIAAGSADILKEQNEKPVITPAEAKTIAAASPEILKEQNEKVKVTKVHDDGDLTVKNNGTNYVVTTEGKAFKEVKPAPELKDAIHTSHELGEKATRGGQEVSRGPHKPEKAGSIPAPATKPPEQPEREGHPISEAENRAIHAWYGEHGESNHGGKKRMSVLTTKQREALPDSAFAIPEERKYPIHDKNHARAALARVAEFGTPEEKQRVAKAIKDRYPEEETLNSYATAKTGGHKIMMTSLKDSPHHPVAPKGSRVSMSNAAPHLTKPHMTRKGRGLTRRSDR